VRTHLHHIREYLDKANITDAKRASLKRKLDDFETALNRNRFNYFEAGRVAMEILSLTANVLALTDSATLQKLLSGMMHSVAEAKAEDDERRNLPASNPQPVMLPKRDEQKIRADEDLDDEIPF